MPPRDLKPTPRPGLVALCLAALTLPAIAAGKPSATTGAATDNNERGLSAFGMAGTGVSAAFESLSRAQQARVKQRCKDVIARPTEANPHKLTLCQTLLPTTNR